MSLLVTGLLAAGFTGCTRDGEGEGGGGIVDCVRLLRLDGRTYLHRAVVRLPLQHRLGSADELVCDGFVPLGQTPGPPTPNGERVDAYRAGRLSAAVAVAALGVDGRIDLLVTADHLRDPRIARFVRQHPRGR